MDIGLYSREAENRLLCCYRFCFCPLHAQRQKTSSMVDSVFQNAHFLSTSLGSEGDRLKQVVIGGLTILFGAYTDNRNLGRFRLLWNLFLGFRPSLLCRSIPVAPSTGFKSRARPVYETPFHLNVLGSLMKSRHGRQLSLL